MKRFEPHCHSMYSNLRLLDCINRPRDIILTASKLGYSGVALTDHEALCGHVKWLKLEEELKKQDLIPKDFKCALGNEIYLTKDRTQAQKYYHFILIAKNTEGHRALRELSSNSWLHSYYYRGMERVPTLEKELEDIVHKYPNTLIASSACLGGRIPELVLQLVELEQKDDMDAIIQKKIEIRDYLLWLKDLFGDDFYIEIAPGDSKDQIEYNKRIKRIASYYGIKQIIGTDAHYLTEDKRPIHKAFLNAKDGDREVDSFYKNAYLMSNEEIIEKIRLAGYTVQDFEEMCNNSNEIYEKIESYNIFHSPIIPECQVENYPIEEDKRIEKYTHLFELKKSDNIQERCWVNDCLSALEKKGKWNDRYLAQLDNEADVLSFISHKLNNCMYSYFNTFKHYIDLFWECGSIVGPGRGCFVPGTKVTLSNGTTKNIEDVQIGDRVFTHKGRIRKVTNTMKYSINEELYTLSINGTDDITCTNNHKFWAIPNIKCKYKDNCVFTCKRNCKIKEKLKPRWVEARELKVDDMVAIPRFHYPEKAINYIDLKDYTQFINFHKVTDDSIYTFKGNNYINVRNVYKRYIHIDKDFLYFLGVFIGDGWVCNRDNYSKIGIAFNSETEKDQLSQKRIEEYLKKLDISYSIIHNQKGKKVNQLIFHNPFLGCFLKLNCGDGAENKHIPDSFLYNNREEMESLLCGLLNSDGSFAENRLSYDTINYNLANQVRNLFSYLGLYASISTRAAHDNCKTSYKVRASGKQLELLSFLDFSGVRDVIQRDENYFYTRIKKITTQNYIGNVYDLSVEEDTSYIVNNVAVHNSSTGFLSNYLLGITQIDPIVYDLADFRFLNKERAELPDIDIDLCPSKIDKIFSAIRKERGNLNLIQVATFGLETSKAAIATACRGYRSKEFPNGIDIDVSQYMSSLVPVERGFVRGISDCVYGNEEKDWKPIQELVSQFEQYPGLLDIVLEIEGLVCRRGIHASGVMFYNNSPYDTTALMRSPNGDITTQFDLSDSESLGDTKFDLLKTKISDKISITIDLLQDAGYFEKDLTKREIYNKYLHPENINLNDDVLWDALENGNVQSVFQFNTAIGIQTVKAIKPRSIVEMTAANALLRLAAQEGLERPLDRYIRFKNDIRLWYNEMDMAGLSKEEQKILEPYYLPDYGVPNSQEALMRLCMDENISHFTLGEANAARKTISKKKIKEIPKLKEKFLSQCPNENFGEYVWQTMMAPQMSYAFSLNHSLAYSFIGVQTLILAAHYPEIVWDTACLIVDAQSIEEEEEEEIDEEIDELDDEEDEDKDDEDDVIDKKDKKSKARDYGKVATAIGEIVSQGISMAPPDISNSRFTFYPDIEHNKILCGISSVSGIGISLVNDIISNRPYSSLEDFISKNNLSKPKMISLIKSGAFDNFGDRIDIMKEYCYSISDTKKRITLQNMKMLIDYGLLPPELDFERRVYNFTKYLKKNKLDANFYNIDEVSLKFISEEFDVDILNATDNGFKLNQKVWDKIYNKYMDNVRAYIKANQIELLDKLNTKLISDVWKKYCSGNISKWEMDSISCYLHEHELAHINTDMYNISDFTQMPEEPEIESIFNMKGRNIPIYKIQRIAGTVLDKDKIRKTVTLLTTTGVVTVKIYGTGFAFYDKQISEIGADGKKHIIEKSMFTRGNKLIVTGIRKENDFILKKYKRTPYHLIERIVEVHDDGTLVLTNRAAE